MKSLKTFATYFAIFTVFGANLNYAAGEQLSPFILDGATPGGSGSTRTRKVSCYAVNNVYTETLIRGINNTSQLIGDSYNRITGSCGAFIQGPQGTTLLSTGDSTECPRPEVINDNGVVAGVVMKDGVETKSFVWVNGSFSYINYGSNVKWVAFRGINNEVDLNGTITNGDCVFDLKLSNFLTSPVSIVNTAPTTSCIPFVGAEGTAINNPNMRTINYSNSDGLRYSFTQSATGVYQRLHSLIGNGGDAEAYAINDASIAVGYSDQFASGSTTDRAVLWSNGVPQALGTVFSGGVEWSIAFDINNFGHIVGGAQSWPIQSGFLYRSGVMQDLNNLLCEPLPTGQRITSAFSINDNGEIIASAQSFPNVMLHLVRSYRYY